MTADRLSQELELFVGEHPQGWEHDDWLGLLHHLSLNGLPTDDEDAIGLALERLRLDRTLANLDIRGLGPKRRWAIGERYGTIWNLLAAGPDDLATVPGLYRSLAEEILEVLQ